MPGSGALRSRLRSVDGPSPVAVALLVCLGPAMLAHLLVRLLLTVAGSLLVTFGGLVAATGRWRPLTPLRTLPVLAAVGLGVSGMHTYDVVVSGARGSIPRSLAPFGFIVLPVAVIAVGSLVRQRGRGVLKQVVAVGVVALAAGAVVRGDPVAAPLALAAYVAIVGAPWLALGYWLTADGAAELYPNQTVRFRPKE